MPQHRKPNARHKLIGTYREDRHGDEPKVPQGDAECPAWVHGSSRDYWPEIVAMLRGMGVMSPVYSIALAMLVDSIGFYIECTKKSREETPVTITTNGNQITNPWWAARSKASEQVLKLAREFGMTPASISSVMHDQGDDGERHEDSIAGIINPKLVG